MELSNLIYKEDLNNGATGPTGATGADAETPILTIGTVTTGDPGTEASATITGTAPDFVLNLTIPQGPTGPTGATHTLLSESKWYFLTIFLI